MNLFIGRCALSVIKIPPAMTSRWKVTRGSNRMCDWLTIFTGRVMWHFHKHVHPMRDDQSVPQEDLGDDFVRKFGY